MISKQLPVGQPLPALGQVWAPGQVRALLSPLAERGLSLAPGQRILPAPLPEQPWQRVQRPGRRVLEQPGPLEAEVGPVGQAPSLALEREQPALGLEP